MLFEGNMYSSLYNVYFATLKLLLSFQISVFVFGSIKILKCTAIVFYSAFSVVTANAGVDDQHLSMMAPTLIIT